MPSALRVREGESSRRDTGEESPRRTCAGWASQAVTSTGSSAHRKVARKPAGVFRLRQSSVASMVSRVLTTAPERVRRAVPPWMLTLASRALSAEAASRVSDRASMARAMAPSPLSGLPSRSMSMSGAAREREETSMRPEKAGRIRRSPRRAADFMMSLPSRSRMVTSSILMRGRGRRARVVRPLAWAMRPVVSRTCCASSLRMAAPEKVQGAMAATTASPAAAPMSHFSFLFMRCDSP